MCAFKDYSLAFIKRPVGKLSADGLPTVRLMNAGWSNDEVKMAGKQWVRFAGDQERWRNKEEDYSKMFNKYKCLLIHKSL